MGPPVVLMFPLDVCTTAVFSRSLYKYALALEGVAVPLWDSVIQLTEILSINFKYQNDQSHPQGSYLIDSVRRSSWSSLPLFQLLLKVYSIALFAAGLTWMVSLNWQSSLYLLMVASNSLLPLYTNSDEDMPFLLTLWPWKSYIWKWVYQESRPAHASAEGSPLSPPSNDAPSVQALDGDHFARLSQWTHSSIPLLPLSWLYCLDGQICTRNGSCQCINLCFWGMIKGHCSISGVEIMWSDNPICSPGCFIFFLFFFLKSVCIH